MTEALDPARRQNLEQVLEAEEVPRAHLADAVRLLAEILCQRHPGRSIEVRVPPFVAVQCGNPGEPRHTRGTPPTVIECQPLPFVRLCCGRVTWAEALARNEISASGVRADISDWLPLYTPRAEATE